MPTQKKSQRILGIDPGYGRIGYGVIEGARGSWVHVAHGCIETNPKADFAERLVELKRDLLEILETYKPEKAGIEQLFFAKNVTTGMKVSEARGVILLTLHEAGLQVQEVTPLQMKQAIVGYGRAEKGQLQEMIRIQLLLKKRPTPDDAADALGVALTAGLLMKSSR
ncbi:MAG: crossover junction endodeoxyribonuclease RuvC [Candidatus Magasanikbacteria bacterium CG_4_9_14_0_2_um_filter_42_11]|uniref:Crossover junction endodeoxyribonuclease RuvC n=1 Tax=Candidatus Magasanikbacteria bacterium CG_4_9_14_0_2_um_filter_42_11 TaxID=1974643 RepID=A0A2M8F8U1_9BACT|nr:MAG: crossover junction endodeoxyribonuclease RuvC [Candidatus Magasanikbacteria bacterium CG10_big_fil_rev_8_21_14_0_10_43_9]PIY92475.1 MAG: crossover junction endodeoxyribonuclease RuvC [Candidatus Magasanikbacteria bacterium CG_4_10_14_0_8_um_filter_42_12]PJC52137.1 MAG: crossover junction endodeoxyribonuclease RuvC [Candidatus Magasanikbacteria bacterium CG_4_9_14_0_2_um_filter_42_11]